MELPHYYSYDLDYAPNQKIEVDRPHQKKKSKPKEEKEEYVGPLLVDYALQWQEAMFSEKLLESLGKEKMFQRYFELSERLLNHPRAKLARCVYSNGGKKTYVIKETVYINGTHPKIHEKRYPGLTDKIAETFYPDTSDNPIERAKRNKLLGGRDPLNKIKLEKTPCSKSGAQHGTLVHNQIEKMTKIINRTGNIEYYRKIGERLDRCTQSFVDYCISKQWFPLRSEFIIFDEDIKISTAVDVFLVDITTWRLKKCELKTGHENEEYGIHPNDVKFLEPLNNITNCPFHRHSIQALSMTIILENKYGVRVDDDIIVRMCPKLGVIEIRELSDWCNLSEYREIIYLCLIYGRQAVISAIEKENKKREYIYVG